MVDLEQRTDFTQIVGPFAIGMVSAQQRLDVSAKTVGYRFELGNGFPAAHDGEVLAAMLDGVEEISEVPSGVGSRDIGHADQIIR